MKIVTAENGKKTVKISKSEWETIGKKNGWMRTAMDPQQNLDHFKKWIIPNLQGINSNYMVNPQSIGIYPQTATRISSLVQELIGLIEALPTEKI